MTRFFQQFTQGAGHFISGLPLLIRPGIRLWVAIPLLLNAILFIGLSIFALQQLEGWVSYGLGWLPDWEWLSFLHSLLWLFLAGLWLFFYSFVYVVLGNLLAAPFNGILSEKVEAHLTGKVPQDTTWQILLEIAARSIGREIQKMLYFAPRALGILLLCFILSFIPGINFLVPVIGFMWGAWWLAIQYIDYPVDNQQRSFDTLKQAIKSNNGLTYGFGSIAFLASTIPVVNILAMPAAVVGGTLLWVTSLDDSQSDNQLPKERVINP